MSRNKTLITFQTTRPTLMTIVTWNALAYGKLPLLRRHSVVVVIVVVFFFAGKDVDLRRKEIREDNTHEPVSPLMSFHGHFLKMFWVSWSFTTIFLKFLTSHKPLIS